MKRLLSAISEQLLTTRTSSLVLVLGTVWLTALAGVRSLMLPDEGRYVGVAWQMLNSGNWLLPTLDGLPFFHKPPLFYWLTGLALQMFGANDRAARVASILGALVAAMITACIVCGASAVLRLDAGLPYRTALALAYLFAALGVLAKGLIGFVLPGAVLLAWILVRKRYRLIPALLPIAMILLFLAVAVPWFLWMQKSYSSFWDYFFVYHHFKRFAETGFSNARPVLVLSPGSPSRHAAVVAVDCSRLFVEVPGRPGETRYSQLDAPLDAGHSGLLLLAEFETGRLYLPGTAAAGLFNGRRHARLANATTGNRETRCLGLAGQQPGRRRQPLRRLHRGVCAARPHLHAEPEQTGRATVSPR